MIGATSVENFATVLQSSVNVVSPELDFAQAPASTIMNKLREMIFLFILSVITVEPIVYFARNRTL